MRGRPRQRNGNILIASVLAAVVGAEAGRFVADTDRFPGWHGELPSTSLGARNSSGAEDLTRDNVRVRGSSQAPLRSTRAAGAQVMARHCRQPCLHCQELSALQPTRPQHTQVHRWEGRVEEVAWTPRAFRLTGFLGEHEVVHLIEKAGAPLLGPGPVPAYAPQACCCARSTPRCARAPRAHGHAGIRCCLAHTGALI